MFLRNRLIFLLDNVGNVFIFQGIIMNLHLRVGANFIHVGHCCISLESLSRLEILMKAHCNKKRSVYTESLLPVQKATKL
jgi:hypothetical protein